MYLICKISFPLPIIACIHSTENRPVTTRRRIFFFCMIVRQIILLNSLLLLLRLLLSVTDLVWATFSSEWWLTIRSKLCYFLRCDTTCNASSCCWGATLDLWSSLLIKWTVVAVIDVARLLAIKSWVSRRTRYTIRLLCCYGGFTLAPNKRNWILAAWLHRLLINRCLLLRLAQTHSNKWHPLRCHLLRSKSCCIAWAHRRRT